MKLTRLLFKPKWQDKDARVRRLAVTSDEDRELVEALPRIARTDRDAGVRVAALRRLGDYEAWRERSTGDSDGEVRQIAREAYLQMLCGSGPALPSLTRRIAELETLSAAEIERVACRANDRDLRAAALPRIERLTAYADRALKDPDAALRASIVARIDDVAVLERIAEAARKTDKVINRSARERAATLRINAGNSGAIASKAQALCARVEAMLRSGNTDESASTEIEEEWLLVGSSASADLRARFYGAVAVLHQLRLSAKNPTPVKNIAVEKIDVSNPDGGAAYSQQGDLTTPFVPAANPVVTDPVASTLHVDGAFASAAGDAQAERERRRATLHAVEKLVGDYALLLDSGNFSAARDCHREFKRLHSAAGTLPSAIQERLSLEHARYKQLSGWQQWASGNRRQEICQNIESLSAADAHPDAIANRVREAREEWRRLDAADGGDSEQSSFTKRFNALCHRALKPTRSYFQKRDELRETRSQRIVALLHRADTAAAEEPMDPRAAVTLRSELSSALHSLDDVEPRDRTALARRIKDSIGRSSAAIDEHERRLEASKQGLIVRAAALQGGDARTVSREVRDLQQQWTALGTGKRLVDKRQWLEFREACDTVFIRLDAAKRERDVQLGANRDAALELLDELAALAAPAELPSADVRAALRAIDARWQAIEARPREFDLRYRKLIDGIELTVRSAERDARLRRFHDGLARYRELRKAEGTATSSLPDAGGPQLESGRGAADPLQLALATRRSRLDGNVEKNATSEDSARDLLVKLEFMAGVETPTDDRQRRMNLQVQRLAVRMRERVTTQPEEELASILTSWFTQSAQRTQLEDRFLHAAQRALASLP